ncbi:BKACE family enzyme [Steroidobacter agaridevorans]|uniref:3-keto-5-aminohexanoate cleavage protein n=1 Tax=Steroidobacter agaridevorans TaxID=2695856 RepID=UPI0013228BC3|nr:3-keto-5-aminohexanoate cleavage protein [Steroidobacter agaridevorans]GFE85172.1 3-keto-5-aminohexanoate cleavage protein [Steroidobacter agaridevorans]
MYYTDDSLLPENMPPLMITGAPYGPVWMPEDCTPENKLPVTWEEQTQAAVDCFNAGATILHIHVCDPKTGHISKNFKEYSEQIARLREAVPKMILQIGGSISFAPEPGEKAEFGSYDARHKLCEIEPKPDQITVSCGTTLYDHTAINRLDDAWAGTRYTNPAMAAAMSNLVADATPEFYLENIKRCVQHGIQPYFALAHIHALELVERLIRRGYYKGPVNGFFSMGVGGACGVNPFDMMELVRRTPQGSNFTYQSTFRHTYPVSMMMIALGQHTRAGIEDNLWGPKKGERFSTLQMIEKQVKMAELIGRPIATAAQTRAMLKIGVTYKTTEETLSNLGLPPNREDGNAGFHVHVTDGKLPSKRMVGSDGHMVAVE